MTLTKLTPEAIDERNLEIFNKTKGKFTKFSDSPVYKTGFSDCLDEVKALIEKGTIKTTEEIEDEEHSLCSIKSEDWQKKRWLLLDKEE